MVDSLAMNRLTMTCRSAILKPMPRFWTVKTVVECYINQQILIQVQRGMDSQFGMVRSLVSVRARTCDAVLYCPIVRLRIMFPQTIRAVEYIVPPLLLNIVMFFGIPEKKAAVVYMRLIILRCMVVE